MLSLQRTVKEALDFLGAGLALTALAGVFGVMALALKLTSVGPVFFVQERIGLNGRPFKFLKFRTMVQGAEQMGLGLAVAHDDARITRIGKLLRDSSLDELPQLVNVLRGEMSLVGPRPTVPSQVARYTDYQRQRLEVKPGITGWAQINGRNDLDWPERIDLDIWYIKHWSLPLDLIILLRTFTTVLRREGLYGSGGVTRDLEPAE